MTKRNNFRRALKQLKSVEIEEKLNGLNEAPTNSMGGVYNLRPMPAEVLIVNGKEKLIRKRLTHKELVKKIIEEI